MEEVADLGDQIRVAVRVRPFNAREAARNCKCCVEMDGGTTVLKNDDVARGPDDGKRVFNFDHCYWSHDRSHPNYASQEAVFNDLGKLALRNAFLGYNVCLFAYGQTGSGKSFSMVGNDDDRGIVPRVATELFERMEAQQQENVAFEVVTSMIEIYSEKIRDLLNPRAGKTGQELRVREHPKKGPYIEGLTAMPAMSYKEIERQIEVGNRSRSVASTHMNDVSSRAHTIFSIKFSQTSLEKLESGLTRQTKKVSLINLVDLAGSERQSSKQLTATEQVAPHIFPAQPPLHLIYSWPWCHVPLPLISCRHKPPTQPLGTLSWNPHFEKSPLRILAPSKIHGLTCCGSGVYGRRVSKRGSQSTNLSRPWPTVSSPSTSSLNKKQAKRFCPLRTLKFMSLQLRALPLI